MVAVIGKKHSGKTTVTVRLAAELHRRGHRVMTIKHGSHTFNIDPSTTDTYRHYHEGLAERVAMASPDKFALIVRWGDELGPEAIAERYMADAGVVLCEGFKRSALPKIEVFRRAAHGAPLYEPGAAGYVAVVTDVRGLALPFPVFHLDDDGWLEGLAELVEARIIGHTSAGPTEAAS
ncbi:MAG TPA: molybdopterin-guanine dinucleotide biosynthesis protein B [Gemmatimonadaceae bacterium]|nr:molybdopterin-guanine dinucleotide biosynthesis protein B [Gemmatimonadaceae bacterium]